MLLRDLINSVDKSDKFKDQVCLYTFAEEQLNMSLYNWVEQERFVAYFVGSWYCTDTFVGYRVYFLDDEPVALSSQLGRKSDENFEWVSLEAYNKVFQFAKTFMDEPEPNITFCNLDEDLAEIGDGYSIKYNSQLFDYHLTIPKLNGEPVTIIEKHKGNDYNAEGQYEPSLVLIERQDGSKQCIEVGDLTFPFNTK
jgi:hypothetical protein